MDFDFGPTGEILTMHEKMAQSRLDMFLEGDEKVQVLWKVIGCTNCTKENSVVAAYTVTRDGVVKL